MDVNDKFPGKINGLVSIDDIFRDFLLFWWCRVWIQISLKTLTIYRIEIKDYGDKENIRFPKCILEDNWEEELKKLLHDGKHRKLQNEIEKIKRFMATAPEDLKKYEKELAELNNLNK